MEEADRDAHEDIVRRNVQILVDLDGWHSKPGNSKLGSIAKERYMVLVTLRRSISAQKYLDAEVKDGDDPQKYVTLGNLFAEHKSSIKRLLVQMVFRNVARDANKRVQTYNGVLTYVSAFTLRKKEHLRRCLISMVPIFAKKILDDEAAKGD
ncbi:hypothetical protein A2U01_0004880 [Trifolium medium]|uniref:Uncharacterized protein n=1 Tax=Trifolium medium TaxID=97028 RepID=A0A392M975_9FABA|nr:hypothetical protein [Trifolium medium]